MSQIVGYKRNSDTIPDKQHGLMASVDQTDHKGNAALSVATYAGPVASLVDDDGSGIVYVGDTAPGSINLQDQPIWRIQKIDTTVNPSTYAWAVKPEGNGKPVRYATFDHIWNDRASLTYA